jgi:predicted TIM-barrel fold metal-dependent hydrolase
MAAVSRYSDQVGVDRALIHPVLWDPDSNELTVEAVRKYPNRFAIMGRFYLDDPKGRDLVAHWKDRRGMLGLRLYFNERHKREWMTDGTLDWLWPAAEQAGVPVALAAALFLPTVRPDRRALPRAQIDRRPYGRAARKPR